MTPYVYTKSIHIGSLCIHHITIMATNAILVLHLLYTFMQIIPHFCYTLLRFIIMGVFTVGLFCLLRLGFFASSERAKALLLSSLFTAIIKTSLLYVFLYVSFLHVRCTSQHRHQTIDTTNHQRQVQPLDLSQTEGHL